MAHAATTTSFRAVSLSISALLWAALLIAAVSIAPRLVQVAAPPEPDPITTISLRDPPPPPPVSPELPRTTPPLEGETVPTIVPIAPATSFDLNAEPFTEPAVAGAPAPAPTIVRPHWLRQPDNLAPLYPARALAREKSGLVSLDCIVRTDGNLACRVAQETPTGWGFGDAALRISQTYQMEPASRDGAPVEARYTLRVPFELR